MDYDIRKQLNKKNILDKVVPRLYSTKYHSEKLKNLFSIPISADIVEAFYIELDMPVCPADHKAMLGISSAMLDLLFITPDELIDSAYRNISSDFQVTHLSDFLKDFIDSPDNVPMYLVTSLEGTYGASVILHPSVQRLLSEILGEYLVLPSSVHEVLAIPTQFAPNLDEVANMVQTINEEVVEPSERLSDHVYAVQHGTLSAVI